PSPWLMRLYVS
ncbi:hypothetical protein D033_4791B, partial [Vibrio parahaemolyticus B-265]